MSDFETRFGGIARLFGKNALERLRQSHVCVIGIGGVGTWAVEALARSGLGTLTLVDMDDICVTNVNRQIHALDGNIGKSKVSAIAERARAINPDILCHEQVEFFTAANADKLFASHFDYLIDAIDNVPNKALLIAQCRERNIPIVTCGGAGGLQSGIEVRVADLTKATHDPLLTKLRKTLRREYRFPSPGRKFKVPAVYSPETPVYPWQDGSVCKSVEVGNSLKLDCDSGFGTASFVTAPFGFAAAQCAIQHLAGAGD